MYMTTRAQMGSIMELIGPELSELSALELENLPYLTTFTLASANINQSLPNLANNTYAHEGSDEFNYGSN